MGIKKSEDRAQFEVFDPNDALTPLDSLAALTGPTPQTVSPNQNT